MTPILDLLKSNLAHCQQWGLPATSVVLEVGQLQELLAALEPKKHGCVCPPNAEKFCQSTHCPRKPWPTISRSCMTR